MGFSHPNENMEHTKDTPLICFTGKMEKGTHQTNKEPCHPTKKGPLASIAGGRWPHWAQKNKERRTYEAPGLKVFALLVWLFGGNAKKCGKSPSLNFIIMASMPLLSCYIIILKSFKLHKPPILEPDHKRSLATIHRPLLKSRLLKGRLEEEPLSDPKKVSSPESPGATPCCMMGVALEKEKQRSTRQEKN